MCIAIFSLVCFLAGQIVTSQSVQCQLLLGSGRTTVILTQGHLALNFIVVTLSFAMIAKSLDQYKLLQQ